MQQAKVDLSDFPIDLHPHPYQRETSLEAWESVQASGWAQRAAKQTYSILFRLGPLTLLELEHESAKLDGRIPVGRSESNVIRRLYDLRDNDLVYVTPIVRKCLISGKNAVTWDVTTSHAPAEKRQHITVCPHCGKQLT